MLFYRVEKECNRTFKPSSHFSNCVLRLFVKAHELLMMLLWASPSLALQATKPRLQNASARPQRCHPLLATACKAFLQPSSLRLQPYQSFGTLLKLYLSMTGPYSSELGALAWWQGTQIGNEAL